MNPDAEIEREYFTVVAVTRGGQTFRGITLNEDDLSIQIRDSDGTPRSFLKDDLKSVRRERRSLMPSYAASLTPAEMDDLISYLRTLRGPAPKIGTRTRQPHHAYSSTAFLDRIGRDAEERPDTLINALEIPAGATVADLGSGTGYFTWRIARAVGPSGKVFAVDVQQEMLDRTAETIAWSSPSGRLIRRSVTCPRGCRSCSGRRFATVGNIPRLLGNIPLFLGNIPTTSTRLLSTSRVSKSQSGCPKTGNSRLSNGSSLLSPIHPSNSPVRFIAT